MSNAIAAGGAFWDIRGLAFAEDVDERDRHDRVSRYEEGRARRRDAISPSEHTAAPVLLMPLKT